MRIQNRTALVLLDLAIGILAALATWIQFLNFGNDAWRLFATWVALLAAIYYIPDALITLLAKRRAAGTEFSPMLQGALIVSGVTLLIAHIVCYAMDSYVPTVGINVIIIDFILPIAMIISWVAFSIKGQWRAYDPFYWLGLIAAYASIILFTGEFMPRSARLVYPYEFLDYPSIGVDTMLWWAAIFAAIILITGFLFWILDFIFSGKLAQNIVMPKIKTVVIEEEIAEEEEKTEPKANPRKKPEEKPVKIVTTGGRNVPANNAKSQENKERPASKAGQQDTKNTNDSAKKADAKAVKDKDADVDNKAKVAEKPKQDELPKADAKEPKSTAPAVRIIERVEVGETKKSASETNKKSQSQSEQSKSKSSEEPAKDTRPEKVAKSESTKSESVKSEAAQPEKPLAEPKAADFAAKDKKVEEKPAKPEADKGAENANAGKPKDEDAKGTAKDGTKSATKDIVKETPKEKPQAE